MKASTTHDLTALLAIAFGAFAGIVLTAGALFVAVLALPARAPAPVAVLEQPVRVAPHPSAPPVRYELRRVSVHPADAEPAVNVRVSPPEAIRMSGPEDQRTGWDPQPHLGEPQPRRR